jgi:16S rRNA (guanine527-N7)-methyltransferase
MLAEGAATLGLELDDPTLDRFALLASELLKWNAKLNLTALKTVAEIVTHHFLDSLTIATLLAPDASLLDIGSGGGFPSLPVKIVRPDIEVTSLDAVAKKINFQRHAARLLQLERFIAVHGRAEEFAANSGRRFDYVVARAVADLPLLARLGAPFLDEGGLLLAMKGKQGRVEVETSLEELDHLGFALSDLREFTLPLSGDERVLVFLARKVQL